MKTSLGLRMLIMSGVTLLLMIPAAMIQSLIHEREHRRDAAVMEVREKWGGAQTVAAPIMTIPFNSFRVTEEGKKIVRREYAHFLPQQLQIEASLLPEIRYRGIYQVVLYAAEIGVSGSFSIESGKRQFKAAAEILWTETFLTLGISDVKGVNRSVQVRWNESEFDAEPGVLSNEVVQSGLHFRAPIDLNQQSFSFSFSLALRGSEKLTFIPLGKETRVAMSSSWPDPSFTGGYLPFAREVRTDGFKAEWNVLHLARNFPQHWTGDKYDVNQAAFGVDLLIPVDAYQKSIRSAKYAILFITLTFLTFFVIELLNGAPLHPIQYLLIGFGLLLFYTLLLSISEHISFGGAYIVAASGTILMIAIYTRWILFKKRIALLVGMVLALFYGALYIILQLHAGFCTSGRKRVIICRVVHGDVSNAIYQLV